MGGQRAQQGVCVCVSRCVTVQSFLFKFPEAVMVKWGLKRSGFKHIISFITCSSCWRWQQRIICKYGS